MAEVLCVLFGPTMVIQPDVLQVRTRMSASGPKQTFIAALANVRFRRIVA